MARGVFRKTSFWKMVGAYRSQWKRFWLRLFTFGAYGKKGMGWLRDPKKALYNWWYNRTSVSIPRLLGYKPSTASFICAMLVASVASIFASPVDATRAGVKAHKIKTERKARASSETNSSAHNRASTPRSSKTSNNKAETTESKSTTQATPTGDTAKPQNTVRASETKLVYTSPVKRSDAVDLNESHEVNLEAEFIADRMKNASVHNDPAAVITPEHVASEHDENIPKSVPKHEKDQYIRKRMIIAGSSYCDKAVMDTLMVGTYFDLVAEPDNPYDKDAVKLVYMGQKIGYIARQDRMAFATYLKLNRSIYGVITDINSATFPEKYEFETWFSKQ